MSSNCLIVNGTRVMLPDELIAKGGRATNYLDDGEPHLDAWPRKSPLSLFVLHETVGDTAGGCESSLLHSKSDLGVHMILDHNGLISNHGDLASEIMRHAGTANGRSIGIEVVNPYNPVFDAAPFEPTIPARWWTWVPAAKDVERQLKRKGWRKVPKVYCLPSEAQIIVLKILVPWLCGVLGIPYEFPTIGNGPKKYGLNGVMSVDPKKVAPGVYPHSAWAHADGRYLLEQLAGVSS
jgi:hypothetical protein